MADKKKKPELKEQSLIIQTPQLPEAKVKMMQVPTPKEFIKTRAGKGGKQFTYVEGGYVIARLNQVFSPIGWDFEISEQIINPTEIVVRGRLMVKDFKTGFSIGKSQYGTKDRIAGVPLGDSIKAAATDCLKKCASLFGVGLDVYWGQMEAEDSYASGEKQPRKRVKLASTGTKPDEEEDISEEEKKDKQAKVFTASLLKIQTESSPAILIQYREKVEALEGVYSPDQKKQLIKAIDKKLGPQADQLFN